MLSYQNNLRIEILMACGEVDVGKLATSPDDRTELDTKIIRLARRVLNKSEKTAFFYAYHCSPSWEQIQLLFQTQLHRMLTLDTVKTYGERAASKLVGAARVARELK